MTETDALTKPIQIAAPRCFVLETAINEHQAHAQAGEHKGNVFAFDIKRAMSSLGRGRVDEKHIDIKLLHRRLVPFWNVKCRSHYDYTCMKDYTINAHGPDAVQITIQGSDKTGAVTESVYRVDQTGHSGREVKLTGMERCITKREISEWVDSYNQTDDWSPKQIDAQQKLLQKLALQRPQPIDDLQSFVNDLRINGQPMFTDNIETIVVPPMETADNVIRRMMQKVVVSIKATAIFDWKLEVMAADLYFRPIFIFEFVRPDRDGNPVERKIEELDALKRDRWVNLQTTEFQISNIPWVKIIKLSADIGSIILGDIPGYATTMKVISAIASQGPGIVDEMKK